MRRGINPVMATVFLIIGAIVVAVIFTAFTYGWIGTLNRDTTLSVSAEVYKGSRNELMEIKLKNCGNVALKINNVEVEAEDGYSVEVNSPAGGLTEETFDFNSEDELNEFYTYYVYVSGGFLEYDSSNPDGLAYASLFRFGDLSKVVADLYVSPSSSWSDVFIISYYKQWNDTHVKNYTFYLEINGDDGYLCGYDVASGYLLCYVFSLPTDGFLRIVYEAPDYVYVLDSLADVIAELRFSGEWISYSFESYFNIISQEDTSVELKLDYLYVSYKNESDLGLILEPGDEVTVLAKSSRGAWESGSTYLVSVNYEDIDTGRKLTETTKVQP